MCDTIGKIVKEGQYAFFAKNSDRQIKEPQAIIFIPEKYHEGKKLKVTYIEVEQVNHTHAILISKPSWMWGAEMGVNDCGVCIGNEAVYTKGEYGKRGLLGMDLLRLALERSNSAKKAVDVIINLLEKYGQGGNCGYEKEVFYDNSFLIMDKTDLFILETKDKKWALKKQKYGSISNSLTITDADKYSDVPNFKDEYIQLVKKHFQNSSIRRYLTSKDLGKTTKEQEVFKIMRKHFIFSKPLFKGSANSPCMHGGDHQTTSSMVVILKEKPVIWITGCSLPCISMYKPYVFGDKVLVPILEENEQNNLNYWTDMEEIHKRFIGKKIPNKFYIERDKMEINLINQINNTNEKHSDILEQGISNEKMFFDRWLNMIDEKN